MISYRPILALAVVAGVGFFGISHTTAQDGAGPGAAEHKEARKGERRGGGGGGGIFKVVNDLTSVTQEQKDKIKVIQTAHGEKLKELRGEEPGGPMPDRTKMQELMKDTRGQVEAVLTEAQKAELAEKTKGFGGGDGKGRKGDHGTSAPVTP